MGRWHGARIAVRLTMSRLGFITTALLLICLAAAISAGGCADHRVAEHGAEPQPATGPPQPPCPAGRLLLVSASHSFAVVESEGSRSLRQPGDVLGRRLIHRIDDDRVLLTDGAALCQLSLAPPPPAPEPSAAEPEPLPCQPAAETFQRPVQLAAGITQIGDYERLVSRALVDAALEEQAALSRRVRVIPEQRDGRIVGIRLFGIRRSTMLHHLGFENGDVLHSVNGFDLTNPQTALEAYSRLRPADYLRVEITRKGRPLVLRYHIITSCGRSPNPPDR